MQPLAVMDQAISRQMDRLATEFNNQAASAVASVRETAEVYLPDVIRKLQVFFPDTEFMPGDDFLWVNWS